MTAATAEIIGGMTVPAALRKAVGKRELVESLGTKDDAVSRLLAELSPAQLEDLKKRLR